MNNISFSKIPIMDKVPSKTEGTDGSTYIVRDKGSVYIYHKRNGEWFRTKMEKL